MLTFYHPQPTSNSAEGGAPFNVKAHFEIKLLDKFLDQCLETKNMKQCILPIAISVHQSKLPLMLINLEVNDHYRYTYVLSTCIIAFSISY